MKGLGFIGFRGLGFIGFRGLGFIGFIGFIGFRGLGFIGFIGFIGFWGLGILGLGVYCFWGFIKSDIRQRKLDKTYESSQGGPWTHAVSTLALKRPQTNPFKAKVNP